MGPFGNIYVLDSGEDRIEMFTADGIFLTTWGSSGTDPGEFDRPFGIAVSSNGRVYVADSANGRVQVFTSPAVSVE